MKYNPLFKKVDEDDSLARSPEFCDKVRQLGCVLETTGGYNSTSNGQVEHSNRFDANDIRPGLSTMKIIIGDKLPRGMNINQFWCCALSTGTMNHRYVYNRMRGDSPYFFVHQQRPSIKHLITLL